MSEIIECKELKDRRKASFDAIRAKKLKHLRNTSTMPDDELQSIVKNTKFADHNTNALTACITKYLEYNNIFVTRQQSQGQYNASLKKFTKSTVKRGVSDIYCLINSVYVAIEVKVGKDRMRPEQHKVREQIQQSGGKYFIAENWPDTYDFLQGIMNNRP